MTCQDAIDRLYEYLDKELDNADSQQIKKHLDFCRLCCDTYEFEAKMKMLVKGCCVNAKAPDILKSKIINNLLD